VEITKLTLWLKTAKRGKLLQDLDASIKCGNSLIADKNEHGRAFNWQKEFPAIFAQGGFDIVLGNPPYVRMETIKPFKPYLEKHYAVASDRADLYAYFYEKGVEVLRPGGRLGYISSSTFFRTGSGEPLRHYLRTRTEIESVVDFGDLQIFEGVTTYPAIVTMRRAASFDAGGAARRASLSEHQIGCAKGPGPRLCRGANHAACKARRWFLAVRGRSSCGAAGKDQGRPQDSRGGLRGASIRH
jgi:hypothetical protein